VCVRGHEGNSAARGRRLHLHRRLRLAAQHSTSTCRLHEAMDAMRAGVNECYRGIASFRCAQGGM
jgi:hypothetical protein